MSGPSYSCISCNFFLHKKCAELPPEIKRHIHPEHPLRLLPNHDTMCDFCNETCYESFVYCCLVCEFNLHIKCAFPPCVYAADQDQRHLFRRLLNPLSFKSISFTCNACGTDGDGSPFMCTLCHLVVHEECISLHFDSNYGVYYCPDCDFVAHVNCSREYGDSATEIVVENEEEQSVAVDDQSMEPSFRVVREIKHGEERIIEEIKHFSHQHNLIFTDKVMMSIPFIFQRAERVFSVAILEVAGLPLGLQMTERIFPIAVVVVTEESKVFFKCAVCDLKLGMKCATLPYKARHEYDDHPLFLTYINQNDYQPSCLICEKDRDPKLWFYRCEECDFDAHPDCALVKYPYFKAGGFEHILNTLTLLLWSTRQEIMQHAISVVSLAMTWPLNVLILTAVLSSTGKEGNAGCHYGNWIAVVGFFFIFGL
ncbi:uncharacterized protein [Populus alba]|uniref:uncharacterized protein n=1 Tax=Populus alba TaxID=43335 RepID=UPI001588E10F|nr:uncharacterized protein LOC118051321 [Populus alba]